MAVASPFLGRLPLTDFGLDWVHPPVTLAHPFDDGSAAVLTRSLADTARGLGVDATAYQSLMNPFLRGNRAILDASLGFGPPVRPVPVSVHFAMIGLLPFTIFARRFFRGEPARGLLAGLAAHSFLALDQPLTTAYGLLLGLQAHAGGWPLVRGGSGNYARAMERLLVSLGGSVRLNSDVTSFDDAPGADFYIMDTAPRNLAGIAGDRLSEKDRARLISHHYGSSVFKIDYALDGPVPWTSPLCRQAGTLHLGGTMDEVVAAEGAVFLGETPDRPFVLAAQPSLFDPSRAPAGKHTFWAYCHVPFASSVDMTERVEAQIERFAPGFRDRVIGRTVLRPTDLERLNPNDVGGSIVGGPIDIMSTLANRAPLRSPYTTSAPDIFLGSAAVPPGPGVHGMCGYHAANRALHRFHESSRSH